MSGEKKEKKYSIKTDFSLLAILIIPIAVAVNFVGAQLASILKLPLYLDTIGTIFASMLCGPWIGALAGGLTNVINGITNPVNFAFIPVNVIVGLVTGFLARGNMFSIWWKWLISIILMALASIISAAPIVVLLFGGITGDGSSLVKAALMATGTNIWLAVIGSDGIFNVIDRIISYFISWFIIKVIPNRTLIKFGCGGNYIKKNKDTIVSSENPAGEP
ncbi:MAG: ECF transporter S component [Spirochaetaceae bacterium]|jgi:energy-coupling factor transport system substrate-specific component|nr:ECF transporter S component [Spirochaetaceae bacterium]